MTVQEFGDKAIQILNFCAFYYVVLLVRCALVSVAAFAVEFALRKTILKNRVFLKSAIWALFIPVLFAGKMKFFDESRLGMTFSYCCRYIGIKHMWICWLYFCAAALYASLLFHRRRKLKKLVAGMEQREVDDTSVYVTNIPVTPSTIGVFRPKIVIPEVILRTCIHKRLSSVWRWDIFTTAWAEAMEIS